MKLGFCTNMFDAGTMPGALKRLAELGYDGVELWQQYLDEADLDEVVGLLDESGLDVLQLCPYFDLTGGAEAVRTSFELNERYVALARTLGCGRIRVFTGKLDERDATDDDYRRAGEALARICDAGKSFGIEYVLEVQHGLMQTSAGTRRLLEAVARENLAVNLQVPLRGETWPESVENLGEHVVHLHAHNWSTTEGDWDGLTYLADGVMDFEAFVGALVTRGFDGVISIEHPKRPDTDEVLVVAEKEVRYLKTVRAKWTR